MAVALRAALVRSLDLLDHAETLKLAAIDLDGAARAIEAASSGNPLSTAINRIRASAAAALATAATLEAGNPEERT